jgi:cell division protein FtsA
MAGSPVVVLDIGASKVVCLVGEAYDGNDLRILGSGSSPCAGLRRNVVIDMPHLVESIKAAVGETERASGLRINGAYTGIAGEGIHARAARSTVSIAGVSKPIDSDDVRRAMDAAEQAAPSEGEIVMHRFVQRFAVDNQTVQNPQLLHGTKLEVETLTIAAARQACTTLQRAADQAGIDIAGFILEPLATAAAVASLDEREMGVAILDIGAGTSDLAVFCGPLRHVAEVPLGGDDIARDLSVVLGMTFRGAEQVKLEHGGVCCPAEEGEQVINFQTTAGRGRTLTRLQLYDVVEARQQEILEFAREELHSSGYGQNLAAGLILTGGGALLRGLPELAEEVMGMPVRVGVPPQLVGGDSLCAPQYATVVGLLRFAIEQDLQAAAGDPAASTKSWTERFTKLFG